MVVVLVLAALVGVFVPLLLAVVFSVVLAASATYGVFYPFPSPEYPFISDWAFWVLGVAYIILLGSLFRRLLSAWHILPP